MTKKYNQLTLEQRYKIEALHKADMSFTAISEIVGVHKSTISRELKGMYLNEVLALKNTML